MEAIRCQGLSRRYGQVDALVDLNLTVSQGVVFGFLGKNGAGKTTTIRLLTGLARPTAGQAWVDGVPILDGSGSARRHFGYLPEEPAFYTWMTPREFLDYVGKLYGLEALERRDRISELLELTELKDVEKRRIGGFSRGMRQRLGLAQSLIHRPPVLFLDEPTSALDPSGRRAVLDLIDRLRGETTVFLSSHILDDVERVCEQIGVIHEGKLILVADRDELLERYASNVVLLEFDQASMPLPTSFLDQLERTDWIETISHEAAQVRLSVNNIQRSKRELLKVVGDSGLILNRYEWVRPSLEEIFLRISM
jgi:ABC-2 type transport system ATP-binding protein